MAQRSLIMRYHSKGGKGAGGHSSPALVWSQFDEQWWWRVGAKNAPDDVGTRLPFRWPRGETGKTLVFSISSRPVDTVHFPGGQRTPGPEVLKFGTVVDPARRWSQ
jgi:hypothetical protein